MKAEIKSDRHGRARVFIDGQEQKGVRSLLLDISVENLNVLTLELVPDQVTFEGPAMTKEQEEETMFSKRVCTREELSNVIAALETLDKNYKIVRGAEIKQHHEFRYTKPYWLVTEVSSDDQSKINEDVV